MIDFSIQKKENDEVFLSADNTVVMSALDLENLELIAKNNQRERVRFCSHSNATDTVHEMFIVHPKEAYVKPHKHLNKVESMMVLHGEVDYIFFDNDGNIIEVIEMGDFNSKKDFYVSTKKERYHSLYIKSESLIFLEVTKGPFSRKDTFFPEWAPEDSDDEGVNKFMNNLKKVCSCE